MTNEIYFILGMFTSVFYFIILKWWIEKKYKPKAKPSWNDFADSIWLASYEIDRRRQKEKDEVDFISISNSKIFASRVIHYAEHIEKFHSISYDEVIELIKNLLMHGVTIKIDEVEKTIDSAAEMKDKGAKLTTIYSVLESRK